MRVSFGFVWYLKNLNVDIIASNFPSVNLRVVELLVVDVDSAELGSHPLAHLALQALKGGQFISLCLSDDSPHDLPSPGWLLSAP